MEGVTGMPLMTVTHFRRGFATNSSSTHSILEVELGQSLPAPLNAEWDESHIEHDDFVVSDRQSRLNYLHAMAADAARAAGEWRDEVGCYRRYLQLTAVIPGPPLGPEEMRDTQLDSLSGYAIPRKIHSPDMDVDFFERIVRFLLSENILIYGGAWFDPDWEERIKGQHAYLLDTMFTISRRISENEWMLFNLYDGTKYSVVFDHDGRQTATPMEVTRALEMIDVSISNACRQQCSFCYRASEPGGPLADIANLKLLVRGLKEIDAMEMVIGGGEPTEHPDFYHFLKDTDFGDLAVSFTTRNLDFIRSLTVANEVAETEVIEVIRNKVKAIGMSVQTADEVKTAEANLAAFIKNDGWHYVKNPQMVFHLIPHVGWENVFSAIIQGKHPLLLLGMKFTGRNAEANRKAYADVLRTLLNDVRLEKLIHDSFFRRRERVGVDTKFIVDVQSMDPDWLKRFDRKSWTNTEGVRSAFIDLVNGTIAPCSFGGKVVKLDGYDPGSLNQAFDLVGTYKPEGIEDQSGP